MESARPPAPRVISELPPPRPAAGAPRNPLLATTISTRRPVIAASVPPLGAAAKNLGALLTRSAQRARRVGGTWVSDAASAVQRARSTVDAHDAWVPAQLREKISPSALIGVALAGVFVLSAVTFKLTTSALEARADSVAQRSSAVAAAPAAGVSDPRPGAAQTPPASAPNESSATLPAAQAPLAAAPAAIPTITDEGALLLNSAATFLNEERAGEAVTLVERALLRSPELRSDPRVGKILLRAANAEEDATSKAAFGLLEGPMAESGAELLYELSQDRSAKDAARRRAQSWIRSKQFAKAAPLPLYTLVRLRSAKTCEDKHALLGLAQGGGKPTLEYLKQLQARSTCAPDDLVNCYPCMRADTKLVDTIAELERRLK